MGEQLEVVREGGRRIVVCGLAQTAARKEELTQSLKGIALVSAQIQPIEDAAQQAQRTATPPDKTSVSVNEIVAPSEPEAAAVNPFQQMLNEHFGARPGLSKAERREISRRVAQFYNAVEADASAAMAEA